MNRWECDNPDSDQSRERSEFDSVIDGDLARRCASPDLTDSIMQRLGYRRTDCAARHRIMWQRWGRRISAGLAASVALFVGVFVHQAGPDARRASDVSIPSAIQNDLHRHERTVGQLIQAIQQLKPVPPRQAPGSSTFEPPTNAAPGQGEPSTSDSTMDPAATAPFQWV